VSEQFEMIVATYGYPYEGIQMSREAAQRLADTLPGKNIVAAHIQYRIISTRLEDDPTNPLQGKVIAVCQEIVRPGPEETK